jgi:ABC-2 type transport system permease protein
MSLRRKLLVHAWAQAVLWLAIALVVNHISSVAFVRFDLTRDGNFSLSSTAKQAASSLERPLVAQVYFTGELEAPYHNHKQALLDTLKNLRAYSKGLFEIQEFDPGLGEDIAKKAKQAGLIPIQYRYRDEARAEIKQVFMGIVLLYGDRTATLDGLSSLASMEYEITRAILTLTEEEPETETIGLLIGNGEIDLSGPDAAGPIADLARQIKEERRLVTVSVEPGEPIPEEIDALLVLGPQQALPAATVYQLDQYLMNGGNLAFFLTNFQPDFRTMRTRSVNHGLFQFLAKHGLRLNKDAILDRKHNEVANIPVNMNGQVRTVPMKYPLIPTTTALNRENPVVRNLKQAVLPFASSMALSAELHPSVTAETWIHTSPASTAAPGLQTVRPDVLHSRAKNERAGPFSAAVALHGRFSSTFSADSLPKDADESLFIEYGANAKMVVVSSLDFVANNPAFVLNTLDWMCEDFAYMNIRRQAAQADPLTAPSSANKTKFLLGMVAGPLLLLFLVGFVVRTWSQRTTS